MTGTRDKPTGSSMPMTDWLSLMLAEIERKHAEAAAAVEERQRRAAEEPGSGAPAHSADVA
jgi:hypothetical protein